MLAIGTQAPGFTLPDQNGENRSLSDYKGDKRSSSISTPRI